MNFITGPVVYGLGIALAAVGVFAGVQTVRLSSEKAAHSETKASHANVLREIADKTAAVVVKVRQRENEVRGLLDSSNTAREEGIANAVKEQQRVVAGVRDESVRLRQQWRGCQAERRSADHVSPESGPDASAELRATGAGDLVRVGDDADIQITGLQAYARACQALTRPLNP